MITEKLIFLTINILIRIKKISAHKALIFFVASAPLSDRCTKFDFHITIHSICIFDSPSLRVLTNNPVKRAAIEGYGLSIQERIPISLPANDENRGYLRAKADRLGHELDLDTA